MRATPFPMFQGGKAEEAMRFYISLFDDGEIVDIKRYGPEGPGAEGTVYKAQFRLAGLDVLCIDSPVKHAFEFTPSFSLFIDCDTEEQLDKLVAAIGAGGHTLMPPDTYGFSRKFAWISDRFGVSWQLNLP
jgi:predicted 3-demethylubiquinone-9 3-methyltransferase (glyoxalase superfamily)